MPLKNSGQDVDRKVQEAIENAPESQKFYPTTRTYHGEWPKMATKSQGKGKKKLNKVCNNQQEWDDFMGDDKVTDEELESLEA